MKKDAELHADEDAKKKELADIKNTADLTIFTAEKSLVDHKDKITEDIKTSVEAKIASLKTAKEGSDKTSIETAIHELSTEMQKIGEVVASASSAQEKNESSEGSVKDAEGEEKTE
jgi:molecular chaperone DnaK